MNVSHGMMDLFFGYNTRVGDVQTLNRVTETYEDFAQNAETPEDRERYANAVVQIQDEVLPKMKQEMNELGQKLGLSGEDLGKALTKEELEKIESNKGGIFSYLDNGTESFSPAYEQGTLLSRSI